MTLKRRRDRGQTIKAVRIILLYKLNNGGASGSDPIALPIITSYVFINRLCNKMSTYCGLTYIRKSKQFKRI